MADEESGPARDDISFLRTEDMICLSSMSAKDVSEGERVCLAAEGFGNRMCFLQAMANKELPFDMSVCSFVLVQALSVRALQEMVSAQTDQTKNKGQSGHRTLLYGHAVQLRHNHSNMYLSCLSTQSSSSDKLAFDVGLTETPEGESCWWTIHPASKQRSEGEKVRVGDDLILVSVASERYLHIGLGGMVIASFQQTLWTVQPISSGAVRQKSVGFVFGGDVLRLFHGDECLTIPPRDSENVHTFGKYTGSTVMYETGSVSSHARSLWKLEHARTKWAEGFMGWGQPCRLRHITSGRYLAAAEDNQIVTFHRSVATEDDTAFVIRQTKDDRRFAEGHDNEGMGTADVKYGDSMVYIQHAKTGLWLSYQTFETKKKGVGRVEEKKAVLMVEGHMDDSFTLSRAQEEEDKSARVIRKCTSLISRFVKALESLRVEGRNSQMWENISLAEVIKTLEDLIGYFAPPADNLEFENRQIVLKALKNRQDLFQEEGMIALILETIDRCSQFKSARHLAHLIGEDSAAKWDDMISYLYLLLAAMIRGNRANCSRFAASRLDWLVARLDSQQSSKGVLDVLHCVLIDSPEALNVIREEHIRTIISLIDKHGRDPKVLDVLCSLCVGNDVAVRSNQQLICDNLLPGRDLLLQTKVVDYVYSNHPNMYVAKKEGSGTYSRWYYEAIVDHLEQVTHLNPHIRLGWANTEGYLPYPGGGQHWGANGVGDDLYSYGFDGVNIWTAGKPRRVRTTQQTLQKGDVIGVCLDLTIPQMSFTVNGYKVKGFLKDFNLDGMFYPVISLSSKVSVRFVFGGTHGKLKYGPAAGFSPMSECLLPKQQLQILPCFFFGDVPKGILCGPTEQQDSIVFVPTPVNLLQVQLPGYIENIQNKLAENMHELWAMNKIDMGWQYGEMLDENRRYHPCLTTFERLPQADKKYNIQMAKDTLKTLVALNYHVSYDAQFTSNTRIKTQKLPNNFLQPNGFKPTPLDLSGITPSDRMNELVELLAENTHNVWSQERISQGWTYGASEDFVYKRSPHLVPYSKVDDAIKTANRETATETVKTLMAYGYTLEPPSSDSVAVTSSGTDQGASWRIYRAEKDYAVTSGKWYYEFEILTTGYMKIGWSQFSLEPDKELGCEGNAYVFDGFAGRKWHMGSEPYGKVWNHGDVIGAMLDIPDRTVSFSLNGELMMDVMGQEIAFKGIDVTEPFVPTFCLSPGQQAKINFGQDVNALKYFTCCGLQEGYEPFCVNMTRCMPLWFGKEQSQFEPLIKDHPRLEVNRVPGGSASPPLMRVHSKTYGTLDKVCLEFLRLSIPVRCQDRFVHPREKERLRQAEERHHEADRKRGKFKSRPHRSLEDHPDDFHQPRGGMARGGSETNLVNGMLDVRSQEKTGSKFSLIDKFSDVSKSISDRQHPEKKSKSPFKMFKKNKSREPSPSPKKVQHHHQQQVPKFQVSASEYSEDFESETESMSHGGPPGVVPQEFGTMGGHGHGVKKGMKRDASDGSFISEANEVEGDTLELESKMDFIDEFYYGVRIFPGQDPTNVFVGWVTPGFHNHGTAFDIQNTRHVIVCELDVDYQIRTSVSRKNCYIVSAGDLQNRYGHHEEQGKRMTPGLLIGCHIDTSTGVLSFSVNGKEVANKFQVEPGAMMFPAVFFEPTNKEVLQFELGRTKTALPLSAVLFRSGKHVTPQCPPRLDVQILRPYTWSRVPVGTHKVHTLKLSEIRGWSMLCEEPVNMMGLHIPEEDKCLDILEMQEHEELLEFHEKTLQLYRSICSHGNHRVAHELTKHVDQRQLMYCIKSKYMPGPLRMGFHKLLISLHLEAHAKSRLMMQKEFIVALGFQSDSIGLFRPEEDQVVNNVANQIKQTVPSLERSVSIRTKINVDDEKTHSQLTSPYFPLDVLKTHMMSLLTEAVEKGAAHIRDPAGGSNENLFVPLIRVVDQLLIIGLLDDQDLDKLLMLIDPTSFDPSYNRDATPAEIETDGQGLDEAVNRRYGLLHTKLSEPVKKDLCKLLQHLCDCQLRHRVESIIAFCDKFVAECQQDQLKRYTEIKMSDMSPALAARKTKEFRCPPQEQMRALLSFRMEEEEGQTMCNSGDYIKEKLLKFHMDLLNHCNHPPPPEPEDDGSDAEKNKMSWSEGILQYIISLAQSEKKEDSAPQINYPDSFQKLIINTVRTWAKSEFISDQDLIREMFGLIHRQYDGVGELMLGLDKAYVISSASKEDINNLLKSLGLVRSLLSVQVGKDEEELLKNCIWNLADNKVFFQHPNLMRALGIHETVMQLMVNTLNKAQQQTSDQSHARRPSVSSEAVAESSKDTAADMVVSCCRFLCYFCRTGMTNQAAMFAHLSYLLDNSCMLLSRPSLRGTCPLDVAYSSLMDNNELALALRESDLDKVAVYLSRCGQQTNLELVAKGYPDMGWDPVEGERFLDFFKFCVWVNGENVEENANLVVRLLIRRPECLGPALRGEGGGLMRAMCDGAMMSQQIAAMKDAETSQWLQAVTQEEGDDRGNYLAQSKYNFSNLPLEDDEDYIDMGGAILDFYSSLVDLLGRCAPDAESIKAGRSDSLRARAILRSLVSMEDLTGVLGLRFVLPITKPEQVIKEDGEEEMVMSAGMPPGLLPQHKAAVVVFLERVYGIEDQITFFRLLEDGFLPDLRAATTLETASAAESDMALALNRYVCSSVLPLLISNAEYFVDADHASNVLVSMLHTVYSLSKCRSLTKNQRDNVSDFLVTFTSQLRPPMMTSLLQKLVVDVPALTEHAVVPLRVLTNHYERCGSYYSGGKAVGQGGATEEERRLTMMLFSGIFDSLAKRAYDPELFTKALPCLSAIGSALSPDYTLTLQQDTAIQSYMATAGSSFEPKPIETARVRLTDLLKSSCRDFAEHLHDAWAMDKMDAGWFCGKQYDETKKEHPRLRPFKILPEREVSFYLGSAEECIKAMLAWGWTVEPDPSRTVAKSQIKRKMSKQNMGDFTPRPVDLRGVTLTREMLNMAEQLAENSHNVWAFKKKRELDALGGGIHPQLVAYSVLTDREKVKNRDHAQELLRFMQMHGFRITRSHDKHESVAKHKEAADGGGASSTEKRFAYRLLEKLLEYVDKAAWNMKNVKPASRFSRRNSYSVASEDVKFFGKVVLPLVERYFRAHRSYFITNPHIQLAVGTASIKEKEMTVSLFSKLSMLVRQRITAFGHDIQISVRCLQTLVHAIDARAVVKNSQEFVRSSLLPFFTHAADDLTQTVFNLKSGRFSHVKGTITRGATSLNYVHMVVIPVLTSMFDHLGHNGFGGDLLSGEQQLCCYRILNALYALGTSSATFEQRESVCHELDRHRPALGECVAAFASTFPVAFLEPELCRYNKNSIMYGITEDQVAAHSLEAKEVMDQVAETLPSLENITKEIEELAESGGKYNEAPQIIEVTLPMVCSYLPFWWSQGPDNAKEGQEATTVTRVTAVLMNNVLGNVLKLIKNNIGTPDAPWMNRIATRTQPIIVNATADMLKEHILPVAEKLQYRAQCLSQEETQLLQERRKLNEEEQEILQEHFSILVRDMYAFYPLLIKYVDLHRSTWLHNPNLESEHLYLCVADVFNVWSKSHLFKKEEQNFVWHNEIDNMALIMPSHDHTGGKQGTQQTDEQAKGRKQRLRQRMEMSLSLNVACLKRLLPIGLNMFGGREQELVQLAKQKLVQQTEVDHDTGQIVHKDTDGDIEEFLQQQFHSEEKEEDDESNQWQKMLYKKIGSKKKQGETNGNGIVSSMNKVLAMAQVLHGLYLVEHPSSSMKTVWKKVVSSQRKRAVMACFRMVPLYSLPKHRAINLFIRSYKDLWLSTEEPGHAALIGDITQEEVGEAEKEEEEEAKPQPLGQLITAFSRAATTKGINDLEKDFLYQSYANIMSQSCHGGDDDEEEEEGDDTAATFQEQEMEKQKLLFEQARLSDRGAAEMMLMYISASRGHWSDMVIATIELGISILKGGNIDVQKRMITHLKEKRDVGFFTSVAGLMQQCSVLDLDAFERCNKAEGLGTADGSSSAQIKNLHDADLTCKLFRFLQLLCEGHNLEFQNYLRTQAGNTTTVNVVICTVDYLLRVQESIMDFYWHYSGRDTIDPAGKDSFCRAIKVAAQVFAAITEYIQGPCLGNQLALAHSRLWDAVGGFLYIFAHMQDKLSKDPDQLELLREFMKLQKEMMIMLLSMLEGNVLNGPIGKQMVDTLVESSVNFEMILKFFDIFLKMKDFTTSEAFMEFDVNKDGVISHKEFRRAMEMQKIYTDEEIEYIMMCVDSNQDGKVDFHEFTDRFHDPAKDIGFNVAVLLTNLSEHMPNDPRLERFLEKARSVLDYFEPYLGRIEIQGGSGRIERVYFEIKQSNIDQWEKPQIKDSKRAFLHSVVNEEGDKEKLEAFVNFCEDSIFEMQHAAGMSAQETNMAMAAYQQVQEGEEKPPTPTGILETVKTGVGTVKDGIVYGFSCLSPSTIREKWGVLRSMSLKDICKGFVQTNFNIVVTILTFLFTVVWTLLKWIYNMMRGDGLTKELKKVAPPPKGLLSQQSYVKRERDTHADHHAADAGLTLDTLLLDVEPDIPPPDTPTTPTPPAAAPPKSKEEMGDEEYDEEYVEGEGQQTAKPAQDKSALNEPSPQVFEDDMDAELRSLEAEPPMEMRAQAQGIQQWFVSMLARNFYNFKLIDLALAFTINFMLLFFKVSKLATEDGGENGNGEDEEDVLELVSLGENVGYLNPLLRSLALLHSAIAFSLLVAYYTLKVPLVVFKREKEIARSLEFDGLYVAEQPSDDDIKGHWDKLVISTRSFPDSYWDKFVKKKVRNKYSEQYEYDQISNLLGMDKGDKIMLNKKPAAASILPSFLVNVDWQYQVWKWGIVFTDNSFLYIAWYFSFSALGHLNYFFFAAHLLDVAICVKTLGTIMQSVTHNGKQLVLTVLLTSIVVYVYTVIAFNFFRKFYVSEEDGETDYKCHDMATCFVFHLYKGVRAGGGIGDEIESPDGDPYEAYRILFDITFFFFVIIILLAIIQGLIIDAFGELRDQLEQVKEDLESSCFICGIGKDYFDKVPHGFETHVKNEHNFANYMFFLMHLINKPDTEYTGQETFVWELYQQRSWDFFPVGDCFRKQYEDDPGS